MLCYAMIRCNTFACAASLTKDSPMRLAYKEVGTHDNKELARDSPAALSRVLHVSAD